MSSEHYRRVKEVFSAAVEHQTGERAAFLAQACAGDVDLRAEVESLLAHDMPAENFIEESAFEVAARLMAVDDARSLEGSRIGRYKVVRELGRGGMGVVYLAEREGGHFQQQVAIKVVKRGLDTEEILRRFRHERQILASLQHPNIARLIDGDETAEGQPFFVMEYIVGLPLLQFCDERELSTPERLQMFRQICSAVSHAHRNLVIHRDLKPSNILVTPEGEPKLLDFGVAKLLKPDLVNGAATQTQAQRVMTPEYASPEQVQGRRVTTATDIYSLGIVLYEMLTGVRPYELKDTSPGEWSRAICEAEPSKPSQAVSNFGSRNLDTRASNPRPEMRNPKSLRGDLDNIVLKAIRKEPERRYQSVEQFSEDIERHLTGLPVLARKDTFTYRASKFAARNRVAVAAASLVLFTMLAGIAATGWQARRARQQARIAEARSAEAQVALAKTEKINRFMQSIFSYANPQWFGRAHGRRDLSVLEAMREIEKRIEVDFRDDPDLRADVYQQIGDSYRTQELLDDAERNLRKALELRLSIYGEDSAKVAESMYILSGVRFHKGDLAEHERLLAGALSIQRRHPEEGNNLPYMTVDYANLLAQLKNDYAGALPLGREALELFRRRYGESHYMVHATQVELARINLEIGDYPHGETVIDEGLKQHPNLHFSGLGNYANSRILKGDYEAAENAFREMSVLAKSPDAKSWQKGNLHFTQSFMAYRQGDYAQALAYSEHAFAALLNDASALYSRALHSGRSLNKLRKYQRAEVLLREEIERLKKSERVLDLAKLQSLLGENLTAQGRFAEAETNLIESHTTQKDRVLPHQYDHLETRRCLAELYRAWGKPDEARKYE